MGFFNAWLDSYLAAHAGDAERARHVRDFVDHVEADLDANPVVLFDSRTMSLLRRDGSSLALPAGPGAAAAGAPSPAFPHAVSLADGHAAQFGTAARHAARGLRPE